MGERARAQIDSAGAFKHVDRHQHGDEERNDFKDDAESFLRALDELVINLEPREARHKE
jgi:hypothetical protein